MKMGEHSDTLDSTGNTLHQRPVDDSIYQRHVLEEAATHFTGSIMQVPPEYQQHRQKPKHCTPAVHVLQCTDTYASVYTIVYPRVQRVCFMGVSFPMIY